MIQKGKSKGGKIVITAKWVGQWICANGDVVEKMYTKSITVAFSQTQD